MLTAKVIPAIKLPRDVARFFSYEVPETLEGKIKKGMLVEVPFRGKKVIGIVYEIEKEEKENIKFKIKKISSLLENSLSLSEKQIKFAEFISEYYYTPLSIVIKTIIPPITKKEAHKTIDLNPDSSIPETKEIKTDGILKNRKTLFIHNLGLEKHYLYHKLIKEKLSSGEQVLILMPESFDIYNFANFYIDKFGIEKVAILTSELTKNQYFSQWKKIENNKTKIIIGTRQAIFAPFSNLKLIAIDEEHNSSYKQWDMNPRYSAVLSAEKLADIWDAKIILSSPSPSVESYSRTLGKTPALSLNISNYGDSTSLEEEIINMEDERKKGNYQALSESLRKELLETIYKRKQAIIFIPRLGSNTITKCKDCGYIAECKECKNVLISSANGLYCARCKKKIDLIEKCPSCEGQNIISFGHGSEKIESEAEKLFENKNIKISRVDSGAIQDKSSQMKIYKDFLAGKIDILIGTQMVLKSWNMKNLSLIAILFPEIAFNQPSFKSKEKAFQFFTYLRNLKEEKKKIIIQSYKAENEISKYAKDIDIDNSYQKELENRKSISKIGYPPFSQLIKLIYKHQNPEICKKEAFGQFEILSNAIKNNAEWKNVFEIIKPYPASTFKEFGKFRYHIIIKSICGNVEARNRLLNLAKKDWIIDIDPDEIL